ncbi:hypothetical protein BV20DRAFT_957194 [Pilatotrama ljubarskyi]|nr:hypothetical protein BV20DRAFT_957194 [Pilatotrama ljubarskyi]
MSAQRDVPTAYAASCNPPRRAKRHRTASLVAQDAPAGLVSSPDKSQQRRLQRPPILPKPQPPGADYHIHPSPDSDSASDEEDEYDPGRDAAPAPKRRGRKPGAMSRSARESLRKLNHSKIEKARRTKINETLATLSTLVNERGRVLAGNPGEKVETTKEDDGGKGGKKGKGKTEEKEFKLDVLVKTVEYMQDLIARVRALEDAMCTHCHAAEGQSPRNDSVRGTTLPLKRKRAEEVEDIRSVARNKRAYPRPDEDESYVGDDEHGLTNGAEEEQPSPLPFVPRTTSTSPGVATTSSPRLPPIASWLPHPYDPSSLMSASPSRSPTNAQLPSPPTSGRFRPTATLANMPALTLPGPAHPLAVQRASTMMPPRQQRKSVSASPSVSPTWTPEDESAASLLLQMSSKSSSTGSSSRSPPALSGSLGVLSQREEMGRERLAPRNMEIVTPGSLLGMRD